ncbi:hypothetical protein DKX38_025899 [Salix brachista]|uniref:CCHC-type domain-containing protein n=1 Tax=Salix brachista TaxID=2182728 RepID=A0A5N5JVH9_9ROSI|nr:hypothetical protein DKX38_025899 [Salix brachista]
MSQASPLLEPSLAYQSHYHRCEFSQELTVRDKVKGTLTLSQAEYVKRVLSRFNMDKAKPVGTPLGSHFKLSKDQSPKSEEEQDYMNKVPYTSAWFKIEDYLYGKKLHLPLLGTKPDNITATDWTLLDRQVLGVIRLTLSRSVAHNVIKEKTTVDLMTALSGMYEKPSANNKVHLMKKLFNLRMSDDMSVAQHLNDFNTITNQLSSVEIEFDDEIRALIILASLPNSWEAMRMAVSNSAGKSKLNYDDIRDLILAEEVRRRDSGEISGSRSALNVDSRGRAQNRNLNRGRSKSRGISKSRLGHQATCWNCGKTGHIKRNCKNPRKAGNDNANVVTEEVQDALLLAVHSSVEDWILDSGASFHTSSHRELIKSSTAPVDPGSDVEEALQEPDFVRLDNLLEVTVDIPEVTVDLPEVTVHERDVSDGESGSSTSTSIIPLLNPEPNVPTAEIRRWWRTTKLPGNLAR